MTQKDLYTDGTLCIFSWNIYCLSVVDRNSKLHSNVYTAMILYLNVIQVAYNLLSGWNVHCWSNIILFPSSISLFSSISCRFTATCHVFYSDIYVIISSSSDVKLHDFLLSCNMDVVLQRRHRYLYSQSDSLKSFLHSFFCHYLWFAISTLRFLWESWYIINVRENRRGSQEWTINRPRSRMDNQ